MPLIKAAVTKQARDLYLPDSERDNACQQVGLALLKALRRKCRQADDEKDPFHFVAFVRKIIRDALCDFARKFHRRRKHFQGTPALSEVLEDNSARVYQVFGTVNSLEPAVSDPARHAETQDFWVAVEANIERLGAPHRQVWDGKLCGLSLEALAEELGVSKRTVCRCWQEIRLRLLAQFAA
jgi:RNA polymerase sigma factor (sigma-70 family)